VQFEIVAVLALLALFTHNHAFWIAGLLLALVPLPDISTPLTSMAQSLRLMAAPAAPAQLATVVADDHPSIEKRGD
jgi:type VI protein secretion system component VasF